MIGAHRVRHGLMACAVFTALSIGCASDVGAQSGIMGLVANGAQDVYLTADRPVITSPEAPIVDAWEDVNADVSANIDLMGEDELAAIEEEFAPEP